jgi:hypothetical protein
MSVKCVLAVLIVAFALGCGGDAPRGQFKDKDRPVPADKDKDKDKK